MSSAIPTFAKRDDLIFCDSGVHFALKTGVFLSRSTVKWFKHNDIDDLERLLEEVHQEDIKTRRTINRRFVVIEGLYQNSGDIVPLNRVMTLKDKYCFRLFLDDSNGFGVLGKTGRGTCELFGVSPSAVEFLLSSMGNAMASNGGFCCGSKLIVNHQRLNSSGYVFSASLPPYLAASAFAALNMIEQKPEILSQLAQKTLLFRKEIADIEGIKVIGDPISPLIHLTIKPAGPSEADRNSVESLLQTIVEKALDENIALTRAKYVSVEERMPDPSISIFISATHPDHELIEAAKCIKRIVNQVVVLSR